ncbi:phosphoglycerate mutase [Pilimelia anulata]|uniref:Phosphoglycerate mutase n=1 Tax=Pilimelia anulata TaxID=53371 RepID=A0A8J3B6U2_9ACTN|nr:histidine phosphatase family protein [Pilimelia anulata]GGJ99997.1 phosphoglycerate mutase [Pilimelia anulata]
MGLAHTDLYLVRHGEQDPAAHTPDGGLSHAGRIQADRVGRRLRTLPFTAIHHSPLVRAARTADIVGGYLPHVPRHACHLVTDRTPTPSVGQRGRYPRRWHDWLDGVPDDERDEDAIALQAAVERLGVAGDDERHELLITHNFVIGWFVRHVLDAPVWRWLGLNQANCAITIVRWDTNRPPTLVSFNDTGHL